MNTVMPNINLHIYHSSITHESRMLKETQTVAEAGFADQVVLIGRWREGLLESEHIDAKRQIWRVRMRIGANSSSRLVKVIRYVEWFARIFWRYRKCRVTVVNCHSVMELPIAPLFKLLRGSKIIYDTHELETETTGLTGHLQKALRLIERSLIPFASAIITVNGSIAAWYKDTYNLDQVFIVRNIPIQPKHLPKSNVLKDKLGLTTEQMLFIYQGALEEGRGIYLLLNVFQRLPPDKHIVFMGMGTLIDAVKACAQRFPNIHFIPAVPPAQLLEYTCSADVGLSIIENISLSYYLSLPNKVFEYLLAGLPIIVSDFPEMAYVIQKSQAGWAVPVDRDRLYALISQITWEDIQVAQRHASEYRLTIGWHEEAKILRSVYQHLALSDSNC